MRLPWVEVRCLFVETTISSEHSKRKKQKFKANLKDLKAEYAD